MTPGIDGVVTGVAVHHATGDVERTLCLDAFVRLAGHAQRAAGDGQIAVELDALSRNRIVTGAAGAAGTGTRAETVAALAVIRAGRDNGDRSAQEIAVRIAADAFAARPCIGDGEFPGNHLEQFVGLDAGRTGIFGIFLVISGGSRHLDDGLAAFETDQRIGRKAFLHSCRSSRRNFACRHDDGILAPDGVACAGRDLDGRARHETHIIIARDTGFAGRFDHQAALAAEDELAFAEEGSLLIFIRRRFRIGSAVRQGVGALDDDESTLLALVVDGCAGRVGQAQTAEADSLLLGTIQFETAVGSRSAQIVDDHFLRRIVDRHAIAADRHDAVLVAGDRRLAAAEDNGDDTVESRIYYIVVRSVGVPIVIRGSRRRRSRDDGGVESRLVKGVDDDLVDKGFVDVRIIPVQIDAGPDQDRGRQEKK